MSKRSTGYKRTYPKQKWSTNLIRVAITPTEAVGASNFSVFNSTIIENPTRVANSGLYQSSSASILKVGRIRVKGIQRSVTAASMFYFVAYVPEGYTHTTSGAISSDIGKTLPYTHPEWLIAWTQRDYSDSAQVNEVSMTSTLKRNLNPGDKIIMGVIFMNRSSSSITANDLYFDANVQFVCRNN